METHERIKYIRNDLNLTQDAFGEPLGVSRDVVNNLERGRVHNKEHMLRLICKTYGINYFWLTEGKGDPYIGPPDILVDEAIKKYNLDEDDREIIERYVKMDPEQRKLFKEIVRSIINAPV